MFSTKLVQVAIVLHLLTVAATTGSKQRRLIQKRAAVSGCSLTSAIEEGSYYYICSTVRENITEARAGIPFTLTITVIDTNNCSAFINAAVEVWHCNSVGIQLTNARGQVTFYTNYPGYYGGRATHIHLKVRFGGAETSSGSIYYWGGHTSHTGQIFFNHSYTTLVQAVTPYSSNQASRTLNNVERVYTQHDGVNSLVTLTYVNQAKGFSAGLTGTITVKVDSTVGLTASSSSISATTKSSTRASMTSYKRPQQHGGRRRIEI